MLKFLSNASNTPLNAISGTVPQMGAALLGWFQPMTFEVVTDTIDGFENHETSFSVDFHGVVQPLKGAEIFLKPEGQRAWYWIQVHSDPSLKLRVDDIIIYQTVQYRVMMQKDYSLYGYLEYHLIEDYTGSNPDGGTP